MRVAAGSRRSNSTLGVRPPDPVCRISPAWPDCMLIRPATVGTRIILRTRRESQYLPGRNYGDLRGTARRRTLNAKKGRIHFTGARTPPPPARTSSPGRDRRWSRRYRIHHRPKRGSTRQVENANNTDIARPDCSFCALLIIACLPPLATIVNTGGGPKTSATKARIYQGPYRRSGAIA